MAGRRTMPPQPATIPFFPDGDVGLVSRCQPIVPFAAFQEKPAYRIWLRGEACPCATTQLATVQPAAGLTCRTATFFLAERAVVIRTTTAFRPAGPNVWRTCFSTPARFAGPDGVYQQDTVCGDFPVKDPVSCPAMS